jgi:hypothetical protein
MEDSNALKMAGQLPEPYKEYAEKKLQKLFAYIENSDNPQRTKILCLEPLETLTKEEFSRLIKESYFFDNH